MTGNKDAQNFEGSQQNFHRAPRGDVAGRDIVHYHYVDTAQWEYRLQAEFRERVGIWCPKNARKWLENLMDEHGFVARDLKLAWRVGKIDWDPEKNEPIIRAPLSGVLGAYVFIYGLAALAIWALIYRLFGEVRPNGSPLLAASILLGMSLFSVFVWERVTLTPHRVAKRVQRCMDGFFKNASLNNVRVTLRK